MFIFQLAQAQASFSGPNTVRKDKANKITDLMRPVGPGGKKLPEIIVDAEKTRANKDVFTIQGSTPNEQISFYQSAEPDPKNPNKEVNCLRLEILVRVPPQRLLRVQPKPPVHIISINLADGAVVTDYKDPNFPQPSKAPNQTIDSYNSAELNKYLDLIISRNSGKR